MITKIAISGYRSLRDIRIALGQLSVITGANGSGKSSLYRALRLLAEIAQAASSSRWPRGGLQLTLWADLNHLRGRSSAATIRLREPCAGRASV